MIEEVRRALSAYSSRVSWEFPAREELRLQACLLAAASIYCAVVACFTEVRGRAKIAYMAGVIHTIACISYLLMSYNMVPLVATAKHGRPNAVVRIVEWSITVPFLLSLVAWLVDHDSKRISRLRTRQVLCLIIGGFGPLFVEPFNSICYLYSCYLQVRVMYSMNGYFRLLRRKLCNRYDQTLIWVLQITLNLLFALYPAVWLMTVDWNLWPLDAEMRLFANLDLAVKLVFTSVLSSLTAGAYDYDFLEFPWNLKLFAATRQVAAFAVDREGRVVHWSSHMEKLTQRPAVEVLFQRVDRLGVFAPASRAFIRQTLASEVPRGSIEAPVVELELYLDGQAGKGEEGASASDGGLNYFVPAFLTRGRSDSCSEGGGGAGAGGGGGSRHHSHRHRHGHGRRGDDEGDAASSLSSASREEGERGLFYVLRVGVPADAAAAAGGSSGGGGGAKGSPRAHDPSAATPEVVFIAATHDIKSAHRAVAEVARGLYEVQQMQQTAAASASTSASVSAGRGETVDDKKSR